MINNLCQAATLFGIKCHYDEYYGAPDARERFLEHMSQYGLSYGTNEEFEFRLQLFANVDARIKEINADPENASFTLGHNQFSTYTDFEKKRMLGKWQPRSSGEKQKADFEPVDIPTSIDWRKKGAVNKVQNQGSCGSCWAFSSIAAMEGEHFIKTGTLPKLSEQQLVDCVKTCDGCNGGLENLAFDYAEKMPIQSEKDYPYRAKNGKCKESAKKGIVKVTNHHHVQDKSIDALKAAIAIQPTCVSVDAEDDHFMYYSGGILDTTKCGHDLDHAITAVGYGEENGKHYFIVRNSWTASWGEEGYIRMSADVAGNGVCGLLLDSNRPDTN